MKTGVPKQFKLLGHTIQVRVIPKAKWKHKGAVGIWMPDKLKIEILGGQPLTAIQQTFCHEWTHAMLCVMSHPLEHDEQFVDQMGHLLQQSLTTFED